MPVREEDYRKLREDLLAMAGLVQTAIIESVRSLVERDKEAAKNVIDGDRRINSYDVKIDEECVELIALRQPMGRDLRFLTTAMKITTDLERIADNAVNIAERALELDEEPILKQPYIDIPRMAEISEKMVKNAIDAFLNEDTALAIDVIKQDDQIDELNESVIMELTCVMTKDPATVSRASKISYISKYLERIGDHSTNIAEMVVYMVKGRIIRHMLPDEFDKLEES